MRCLPCWTAVVWLVVVGVSVANAQDKASVDPFASGVHRYLSADYAGAFNELTALIKSGSHDPRAYYFRGLASLNLGRQPDALADFAQGAKLEAKGEAGGEIGKCLERVQGRARLTLEGYRALARVGTVKKGENRRSEIYDAIQMLEAEQANPPASKAPATELPQPSAQPPTTPEKPADNPLGT